MNGSAVLRKSVDITSYETYDVARVVMGTMLQPPVNLLGLIANVINIIIYLKLGLKDSLSICFFVLSCSDLMCVLLLIVQTTTLVFKEALLKQYQVAGGDLCWLMSFYYVAFYDISHGITTFIAVQRCWCVALPLRFKNTFTTTRTSFILTAISLMFFTLYIPVFSVQGMHGAFDPVRNKTILKLWTSENMGVVFSAVGLVALVFTTTCQVTVIFCLFVLALSLRASYKFRNSTKLGNTEALSQVKTHQISESKATISCKNNFDTMAKKSEIGSTNYQVKKTSTKEMQAIKSTTFVAVLFVSCNTFKLINYYVIVAVPEYSLNGLYANTYLLINYIRVLVEALHVSCNMFVYLTFNTRFRAMLYYMLKGGYGRHTLFLERKQNNEY